MPITKHTIIQYQALEKCFQNNGRSYFINDLMEACQSAFENHTEYTEEVQKRQIYDDIAFLTSENGYNAPIEKS